MASICYNKHIIGSKDQETLHPIQIFCGRKPLKTLAKISLVLCIILFSTVITFENNYNTQAATATALHVKGNKIQDVYGNTVTLRGIGRAGDIESASGMWSGPGDTVFAWGQKWYPISDNIANMEATFKCYQQYWKVNMIRIFISVNWYLQDNITAATEDPDNYPTWTTPISYRNYIATVASEAAKYGIYVDICPYQLLSGYEADEGGGEQGLPLCGWDTAGTAYINSTGLGEQEFWRQFWTILATEMKDYPNAIFEAYNEPQNTGTDNITPNYLTYLTTMYNAVRNLTSDNLIFMQWQAGYIPTYNDLSWCQQINNALPNAVNLVYTTHAYRHSPYYNSQWGTTTTKVTQQITTAIQSMGVTAPLVINEAGSCQNTVTTRDLTNEVNWWTGLCSAANTLGVGLAAYYWMSDTDLGPTYSGLSLLTGTWGTSASSPTPNRFGRVFLNSAPTTSPTSTPTATPTVSPIPSPTPTTKPTASPSPTPTPSPTPRPTQPPWNPWRHH